MYCRENAEELQARFILFSLIKFDRIYGKAPNAEISTSASSGKKWNWTQEWQFKANFILLNSNTPIMIYKYILPANLERRKEGKKKKGREGGRKEGWMEEGSKRRENNGIKGKKREKNIKKRRA